MARFRLGRAKVKDLIEKQLEVETHLPDTVLKYVPLIIQYADPEENLCEVLCGIKQRSRSWTSGSSSLPTTIGHIKRKDEEVKEEIRKKVGVDKETWELILKHAPRKAKLNNLLKKLEVHKKEFEAKEVKENKPKIADVFPKSYGKLQKNKELEGNLKTLLDLRYEFCGFGTRKIKKILRENKDPLLKAYLICLRIIEVNLQAKIYRDKKYLKNLLYGKKIDLVEKLMAECRINGWGYGFNWDFRKDAKMISFSIPGFKEFICFHLKDERFLFATPFARRIKKKKTNIETLEAAIKSRLKLFPNPYI